MPFQAWISRPTGRRHQWRDTLQWGHALSGMDILVVYQISQASEMLQWGHALSGMDIGNANAGKPKNQRFNGAMPFQAWICRHSRPDVLPAPTLQWGHALSGMDILSRPSPTRHMRHASMGPCPFRHGYEIVPSASPAYRKLQWGHALSGMDIPNN